MSKSLLNRSLLVDDIHYLIEEETRRISGLLGLDVILPKKESYPGKMENDKIDCALYCGDNLEILESLCHSYFSQVDACYIDPPYNTGNKFVYNDLRKSKKVEWSGSHSDWMSFMLPRLVMAKMLLKPSGIISVSIDDYEQPYLRILLDQVFGEENFIGNIVVHRSKNGKGSKKSIATTHEYILMYGKSKSSYVDGHQSDKSQYTKNDRYGDYKVDGLFRKKGDASRKEDRPNMFYPLYYDQDGNVYIDKIKPELKTILPIDSNGVERRWLWGKDKTSRDSWKLYASKNGVIYVKNYYDIDKRIKVRSIWDNNAYLTERATKEIKRIYGEKIFETPKPLKLIEDLLFSHTDKNSIVIDFFAGTGTTAHAVNNLNIQDGGKRKVILVEQNTPISDNHIAKKLGYDYISDITKKRLDHIKNVNSNYCYQCH